MHPLGLFQGTSEHLMAQLVEDNSVIDPTYVEDFLLTHRTFIDSPVKVANQLFEWFSDTKLRDRVTRVVLLWVNNHFTDFEMDPEMMQWLEKFETALEAQRMTGQLRLLNIACAAKARARTITLTRPSRDEPLQFTLLPQPLTTLPPPLAIPPPPPTAVTSSHKTSGGGGKKGGSISGGDPTAYHHNNSNNSNKYGGGTTTTTGIGGGCKGIFIAMVEPGSRAEELGLKRGDQILEVNGQNFERVPFQKAVEKLLSATHLAITVKSNLLGFKEMLDKMKEPPPSTTEPVASNFVHHVHTMYPESGMGSSTSTTTGGVGGRGSSSSGAGGGHPSPLLGNFTLETIASSPVLKDRSNHKGGGFMTLGHKTRKAIKKITNIPTKLIGSVD
ncbi:unnamed protein product, partial [Notodromas monacha]